LFCAQLFVQPIVPVSGKPHPIEFGLFFDIDGVITRGRTLLPHAKSAFKLLADDRGHFLVPSIFVTNAGNTVRQTKAKQLSDWLGIHVGKFNRLFDTD
jgi:ribonucleotide monophosphatase NagD (HAD superfamily)